MTTPPEDIKVECPKCARTYDDWYRGSVNADLDPEMAADAEYLRACSTATCPSCGHVVELGTLLVEGDVWRFGHVGKRS